jgi:hypothetical protein
MLGLVLMAFVAFFLHQAFRVPRASGAAGFVAAADEETGISGGDEVDASVRASSERAPERDLDEIRRRLTVDGPATYIGEILAAQDSALYRWPDREAPLAVWLQPRSGAADWRPAYMDAARAGFSGWENAGIPLRFAFVSDSASAEVHVVWAERLTEGRRIGSTYRVHDQYGWIRGGRITIALQSVEGESLDPGLIRATALHEVGHLLGLNHTADESSIMTASANGQESLSRADLATMRLLYALPPGFVR